jgi:hypothetical protein
MRSLEWDFGLMKRATCCAVVAAFVSNAEPENRRLAQASLQLFTSRRREDGLPTVLHTDDSPAVLLRLTESNFRTGGNRGNRKILSVSAVCACLNLPVHRFASGRIRRCTPSVSFTSWKLMSTQSGYPAASYSSGPGPCGWAEFSPRLLLPPAHNLPRADQTAAALRV